MLDNGLPAGWQALTVGDLAEVIGGSTPSKNGHGYFGGSMPWATPTDITGLGGKRYIAETAKRITEVGRAAAGLRVLPVGTILMTSRATIGDAAIAQVPITTNQGFQSLVPNTGVEGLWLYYAVTEKRALLNRLAAGSTFKEVSRGAVRKLQLAVPPADEQRGIAEVLDSIDAAIEKTETVIAATERLRSALLSELLTRGVPGWHTEWKQVPGIGTIPVCWDVVRLGDCGKWLSGGTPSKSRADFWVGSVPWVSPKDMKVRIISDAEDHISHEAASQLRSVQAGAILVVVRGMILAHSFPVGMTSREVTFNQDMRALTCGTGIVPGYLLAYLESRRDSLVRLATPSTHGTMRIVSEELFDVQVPKPSGAEQSCICEAIQALDQRSEIERVSLRGLKTLKPAIAEALLSGRVRVGVGR